MSYYMYKKKELLEVDGKLFMLALYADSSVTTTGFSRSGKRYTYHPKEWCVIHFAENRLLLDKAAFQKKTDEIIDREYQNLNDYSVKYGTGEKATCESYCYAGNVYPGGGKVKNMKAFYSSKKPKDADRWLSENPISLTFTAYSTIDFRNLDSISVHITSSKELLEADDKYSEFKAKYPLQQAGICIGVAGLNKEI